MSEPKEPAPGVAAVKAVLANAKPVAPKLAVVEGGAPAEVADKPARKRAAKVKPEPDPAG